MGLGKQEAPCIDLGVGWHIRSWERTEIWSQPTVRQHGQLCNQLGYHLLTPQPQSDLYRSPFVDQAITLPYRSVTANCSAVYHLTSLAITLLYKAHCQGPVVTQRLHNPEDKQCKNFSTCREIFILTPKADPMH